MTDFSIPQNIDAEKALLGSVLIDPLCRENLCTQISPDYFYVERNRKIWEAFVSLWKNDQPIDYLTASSILKEREQLFEIGGEGYLIDLVQCCPNSMNIDAYAKMVRDAALNRKIVNMATAVVQNAISGQSSTKSLVLIEEFISKSQELMNKNRRIVMTAKELCSAEISELSWIVDRWIIRSALNLFAGMPGTGKTFLTLDLALGVSLGTTVWNNFKIEKERVLYHYLDGSLSGMHSRLKKLLVGRNAQMSEDLIFDFSRLDLRSTSDIAVLKQQIQQLKVSIVIFDVFAKFIPGADENSVSEISPVMNTLREISNSFGTTFILLHHLNKGSGFDYSYRVRGSSEILGSVDTAIIVTQEGRGSSTTKREIIPQKIREAENPSQMQFRIVSTDDSISLCFEDAVASVNYKHLGQREEISNRFIETLQKNPEKKYSKADLLTTISDLNASPRTYARIFQELNDDPRISITKDGTRNYYAWNSGKPTMPLS